MAEPAHDTTPLIPFSNTPALATADVISLAEVAAKRAAKFAAMIDTLEAGPAVKLRLGPHVVQVFSRRVGALNQVVHRHLSMIWG